MTYELELDRLKKIADMAHDAKKFANKSYERERIKYEYERNKAMDAYFDARKFLPRNANEETVFEGGFWMAWELLTKGNQDEKQ